MCILNIYNILFPASAITFVCTLGHTYNFVCCVCLSTNATSTSLIANRREVEVALVDKQTANTTRKVIRMV